MSYGGEVDSGPTPMEDVSLRGLGHLVTQGGSRMPRHSIFNDECEPKLARREEPTVEETLNQIAEARVRAAECEVKGISTFLSEIGTAHKKEILSDKSVKLILRLMHHVENCDRY